MRAPMLPGRRRALAFDDALTDGAGATPGSPAPQGPADRELRDLLATVDAVRELPPVTPDPDFVARLRIGVVAAAERELAAAHTGSDAASARPDTSTPAVAGWRRFGVGAAATALVVVGAGAGLASAATESMPGDLLYPVKRAVESADVALEGDDAARGATLLAQAETRLGELQAMVHGGSATDELLTATLDTFADEADQGGEALLAAYEDDGDPSSLQTLDDFTIRSGHTLTDLAGTLPEGVDAAYSSAAGAVTDLRTELDDVCSDCSEPDAVQVPTELLTDDETLPPGPEADGPATGTDDPGTAGGLPGAVPETPGAPGATPGEPLPGDGTGTAGQDLPGGTGDTAADPGGTGDTAGDTAGDAGDTVGDPAGDTAGDTAGDAGDTTGDTAGDTAGDAGDTVGDPGGVVDPGSDGGVPDPGGSGDPTGGAVPDPGDVVGDVGDAVGEGSVDEGSGDEGSGGEPSTDPGSEPGTDPGTDPATDPGTPDGSGGVLDGG